MKVSLTLIAALLAMTVAGAAIAQTDNGQPSRDDSEVPTEVSPRAADAEQARERVRAQEQAKKQADEKKAARKARPEAKASEKKAETRVKKEGEPAAAEPQVSGELVPGLLPISDEEIRYSRIPGITIKAVKEQGDGFVSVNDDKKVTDEKKKSDPGGLFGLGKERTKAVAGWGILVMFIVIFFVYLQTRARRQGKRVVRTIHKK